MIFTNCRVILADAILDDLDVVARDGKIAELRAMASQPGETIDLRGNFLAPGFVDVHVHGANGHDAMEANADAFRAICDYHASGGTTSLLLTTATAPIDAIVDVLKAVRDCRPTIPQIAGVHIEGPFISKTKHGAQRAEFIRNPTPQIVGRLLEYTDVIKRITIAPELPGALEAIENFHARKVSVSGGHSNAWDDEARSGFARGMRSVTHTFNCMSSARRRGIHRVAGLLEFALSEPEILCELIADGHHVSATLMKTLYRAKGAAGICLVTDATAGAGLADGSQFSLFGNECVLEGGVCLLADHSALAGSAARMIDLVRTLVDDVGLPLYEAITMATDNPARAIGPEMKARVAVGAETDLVVLSSELEVLRTFAGGKEIFSH